MDVASEFVDRKIRADDILSFDSSIMMCTILDMKGKVSSYAETAKWKSLMLPPGDLSGRALLSHLIFEGLRHELGKMRFKIAFTDTYNVVSMRLGKHIAVFILPCEINAMPVCLDILRSYAVSGTVPEQDAPEVSGKKSLECQNCGRLVGSDYDPAAEGYLIDVQERVDGALKVVQRNIPITICSHCKRKFGKPRYLFRGQVRFEGE